MKPPSNAANVLQNQSNEQYKSRNYPCSHQKTSILQISAKITNLTQNFAAKFVSL